MWCWECDLSKTSHGAVIGVDDSATNCWYTNQEVVVFPASHVPLRTTSFAITIFLLWEVGSKRPVGINIEKAWNLTFAYSPSWGSGMTFPKRTSKQRPRRIWNATKQSNPRMDALWRDSHIPKGVYRLLVSDRMKFSGFHDAKTSANKRFYNMSANFWFAVQR